MLYSKKIVLAFISISLLACAPKNAVFPDTPSHPPGLQETRLIVPRTIADPEQGLRDMINAHKSGHNDVALIIGRHLAEQYPDTPWYKRALFLSLQAQIQSDRSNEAEAAMLRVKAEYPEMADYAVSALADYYYSKSLFTQAAALYQQTAEQYPKSPLAMRAAYWRGIALLDSRSYGPAVDSLEIFLQNNPRSEFAPDAGLRFGHALYAQAEPEKAIRAYRNVWMKYPGTASDQEAVKALKELSTSGVSISPWTADEFFERGRNLFRAAQYDKAIEAFGKMLEIDPTSVNRAEALLRIGVSRFHIGKRSDAAVILGKMVAEHPRDQRVPEALYWMGRSYGRINEREKAVKVFQKLATSYRESEWADDALFLSGNLYRDANDMKKALALYGRLAIDYPESKFSDSAIWWNAWAYYQAQEFQKAEKTLQELIHRYPRSFLVSQAMYWQGRIAEKKGNAGNAALYYGKVLKRAPYTYYGYRAAERLSGIDGTGRKVNLDIAPADMDACAEGLCLDESVYSSETDEGPPVWTDETRRLLAAEPAFKKSHELMHLAMRKEAAAELWHFQEKLPRKREALIGLSKAFFELGDYHRSLLLVLRNYERYLDGDAGKTPADLWLLAYPQGYWDSIVSYSRKYGQDPYFVAAIIRQESQFHSEAQSPAGARGVMQVMPATGDWVAQNIRLQGFDRSKLFDSDTGINIGTWYISHLMKRLKGDPLLVAAAYNAGPEAVVGWMGALGSTRERDEFVEAIPFAETRGYVKKVLRNYAEYRRIYGSSAAGIPAKETGPVNSLILNETGKMK